MVHVLMADKIPPFFWETTKKKSHEISRKICIFDSAVFGKTADFFSAVHTCTIVGYRTTALKKLIP